MNSPVLELAVRRVKPGREDDFRAARSAFLSQWKTQPGATADREFAALMTLPTPMEGVFVGMTAWESPEAYQAASGKFWDDPVLSNFMDTVEIVAFAIIRQTEGPAIDLASLATEGQVLEVAVRVPKGVDVQTFEDARQGYVGALGTQPGVLASYEFAIVDEPMEGRRVGMTLYASKQGWQDAMSAAGQSEAGGRFFSVIDPTVVAYVAPTSV